MTALLDAPVGTLDVSRLEERQPDVPLTCTKGHLDDNYPPCQANADWEGLCMGCGHVHRRCWPHYMDEVDIVDQCHVFTGQQTSICWKCSTPFYLDQYVRIGA